MSQVTLHDLAEASGVSEESIREMARELIAMLVFEEAGR